MLSSLNGATKAEIKEIIADHGYNQSNLLPILQRVQNLSDRNYIPKDAAFFVANELGLSPNKVSSIISFFSALSAKPRGKYVIKICNSTACLVNDYKSLQAVLEENLKISVGETTEDGLFSLEFTECIGACDISPAFRINDAVHGNLTEEKIADVINSLKA